MNNFFNAKKWWKEIDKINFILISILIIIGLILSFSVNNSLLFLNKHLFFSIFSFLIMIFLSSLDQKILRRISFFSIIFFIIILIFVLFFDYEINGSKRWLKLFGFSLQPSEFIKPLYIILSAWFVIQGINGRISYFVILFFSFVLISSLIVLQPDFGMTLLISFTFFCQLFIAGLSIYLVILALLCLASLSFVAFIFLSMFKTEL